MTEWTVTLKAFRPPFSQPQHNSLLINSKRWWNLQYICRKGQMSHQFHGGSSFFLFLFLFFFLGGGEWEISRQFLFVFTLLSTEEQPPPSKSLSNALMIHFSLHSDIFMWNSRLEYIYRWCCPSFSILSSNGLSTSCAAAGHARPEVTRAKSREGMGFILFSKPLIGYTQLSSIYYIPLFCFFVFLCLCVVVLCIIYITK